MIVFGEERENVLIGFAFYRTRVIMLMFIALASIRGFLIVISRFELTTVQGKVPQRMNQV